jgi:hypothetical protein
MEVRKHDCLSFFYKPNQERVLICDKEKRLGEEVKDEIRDPGASGDHGVG